MPVLNLGSNGQTEGDHPASQLAIALASLLADCTDEIRVTGWDETEFADLELDECVALLEKNVAAELAFELAPDHVPLGNTWSIRFRRSEDGESTLTNLIEVAIGLERSDWILNSNRRGFLELSWLQSQLEFNSPLLVLALPRDLVGIAPEAWNAIVALASRCGQLSTAELTIISDAVESTGGSWFKVRPSESNGN